MCSKVADRKEALGNEEYPRKDALSLSGSDIVSLAKRKLNI